MRKRHTIQFPSDSISDLAQDAAYFYLIEGGERRRIRLHDYDVIYAIPGLYEQLFYDRLRCQSPQKVAEILDSALRQAEGSTSELRVLDLGAGNGMMGEALVRHGVSRLVGVDIIEEAYQATERDRPGIYDAYYVMDFCDPGEDQREEISSWHLDCLTTVAALGFGDIPVQAFISAFNAIRSEGWVAFNIKETFLNKRDDSGFSRAIRELIFSEYLDLCHLERYRHRYSVEGRPLYYFAIAGRKKGHIPPEFIEAAGLA